MQSIIVIGLLVLFGLYSAMEIIRNNPTEKNNYSSYKASEVAGNIMQYTDILEQYAVANYDVLHEVLTINPGTVEKIKLVDYTSDNLSNYNQKNLQLFLNYQSVIFNYSEVETESQISPTLYLATSWSGLASNFPSFSLVKIPEIMGLTNQMLSQHLYQGDSTYWTVPLLLSQNNCKVVEMYSQIPNDSNGNSQLMKVNNLFNNFCNQIQSNSAYKFLNYVFLEPVFKTESA